MPESKTKKDSVDETTPLFNRDVSEELNKYIDDDKELSKYLPFEIKEGGVYPANRKYRFTDIFSLFRLAWNWHKAALIVALVSAASKCLLHSPDKVLFDSNVFKAIFVAIGFCLGFRTVGSNKRMDLATQVMQGLISSTWNVILLFPHEQQTKISRVFLQALEHSAYYIQALCENRRNWWAGVVGVTPKNDGLGMLGTSPRAELLAALDLAEAMVYKLEDAKRQTKKRAMWGARKTLLDNYDRLIQLCLPAITDRYASLLDICLTMFAAIFPWGIKAHPLVLVQRGPILSEAAKFDIQIPPQVIIIVSSLFVMIVLLGINANAQENEDPLGDDERDLKFSSFFAMFEIALARHESARGKVRQALKQSKADENLDDDELNVLENATLCQMIISIYRQQDKHNYVEMPMEHWRKLQKLSVDPNDIDVEDVAPVAEAMRQALKFPFEK